MRHAKIKERIMKDIMELTLSFQFKFPEIYENLMETPLFLTYQEKDISEVDFKNYREFLKNQLDVFEKEKANNMLRVL